MQQRQDHVAGASRSVGDIEVMAIYDGPHHVPLGFLVGVEPAEGRRLGGVTGDFLPLSVNCFVIRTGGKTILVDAGGGMTMGTLGLLPANLRAAGVMPEDIDHVLLTHLHRDHSNGLIDAAGAAAFPVADVNLHQEEARFYLDRTFTDADPERWRNGAAEARRNLAPYRGRVHRFPDGEVFPGVSATLLPGHTPGHTGFLVHSGGEQLLIWGDIVHLPRVQVPRPDVALAFDVDPNMARATRQRTFDRVAQERLCVAGAHLDHPGFGYIVRDGGGYRYEAA
jgi:glyoxylase-like metal-dependent hydrolase (beta-lactamase superfamily II)